MTVAELLAASRAAHAAYQQEQRKTDGKTSLANYALCEQHVARAYETRAQAHAADPDHADAAWQSDTVPHARLMEFYARYPSIP